MAVTEAPPDETPKHTERKPLSTRARRSSEFTRGDQVTRALLGLAALLPTAALVFLAYELVKTAYPAIIFNGWHFFTSKAWATGNQYGTKYEVRHGYQTFEGASFGILPLVFGTLISSLVALLFAVPISVGGAILLVERIPRRFQDPLGVFLELLAGIPSVVFGLWGLYAFGPWAAKHVYPLLSDLHIPWLTGPAGSGQGMLTASLVLAVMIIPIVASTTRELIRSVPSTTKEGAVALGLTPSESVRLVTLPFVRTGILAAAILGWARALGETIAVLIISGFALGSYPKSIFDPFSTIASAIAALLDGALQNPIELDSLAEVALVLLIITLLTNFGGRLLTRKLGGVGLPVGRGV